MNAHDWDQVKAIIQELRRLPREKRRAHLDALQDVSDDVRREAASLLAHLDDETFMEEPALGEGFHVEAPVEAPPREPGLPTSIGQYRIVGLIGRGGMGVVYEAEQRSPHRAVAIKVLRTGGDDRGELRRFLREADTLARLRHPCICSVLEAGQTDDGRPFFAMELVRGEPLSSRAPSGSMRERIEFFVVLCRAIHYAHQRGVIHRDLKPSNVLVDEEGKPKILDFGLARITDTEGPAASIVTEVGNVMGTLPYMSPEQARGTAYDIDVRSDVYALGVMLYEQLVGRLPYDVSSVPLPEAVRVICETAPRRPSAVERGVRGDVETIVLKTLEKEPDRRYASAAALADDLERFLAEEPILARPSSMIYQVHKLIRRHRLTAGLLVTLIALSLVFGVVSTIQATRFADQRDRAQDESERRAELLYTFSLAHAQLLYEQDNTREMERVLDACDAERRGWEWYWLRKLADESDVTVDAIQGVREVLFADGRMMVIAVDETHAIRVHFGDAVTPTHVLVEHQAPIPRFAASVDGRFLASADQTGVIVVWDLAEGAIRRRIEAFDGTVDALAFSDDGAMIVASGGASFDARPGTRTGDVRVVAFDSDTGERLYQLPDHGAVFALAFTGDYLVTGSHNRVIGVWEAIDGTYVQHIATPAGATAIAVAPDASWVVSGHRDHVMRRWSLPDGALIDEITGHDHGIASLSLDVGGMLLASVDGGGSVRVRRIGEDDDLVDFVAPSTTVERVGFVPGNTPWVYTLERLGAIRFRRVDAAAGGAAAAVPTFAFALAHYEPTYFTGHDDGVIVKRAVKTGAELQRIDLGDSRIRAIAVPRVADRWIAAGAEDGTVRIVDIVAQENLLDAAPHTAAVGGLALAGDDVLSAGADGAVVRSGDGAWRLDGAPADMRIAVDRDRGLVWGGASDGRVFAVDASSGEIVLECRGHEGPVNCVVVDEETGIAYTGGEDRVVRGWTRSSEAPVCELRGHLGPVLSVAVLEPGRRIVSGGTGAAIKIWDPEVKDALLTIAWPNTIIAFIETTGRSIVAGDYGGAVRRWTIDAAVDVPDVLR